MKKQSSIVSNLILKTALGVTKMNVNSACAFHIYQPQLPTNAKKLQKF